MPLTFDEYQEKAKRTMGRHGSQEAALANWGLGLAGEAGEAVDDIKKILFHGRAINIEKLMNEMGDTLWYLSAMAETLDITLEDIAMSNLEKLKKRYPEGFTLGGGNR